MSNAPPLFEIEPFRAEALEGEDEVGRRRRPASPAASLTRTRKPWLPRPRPYGPRRGRSTSFDGYAPDGAFDPAPESAPAPEAAARPSEYVRWVQFTLNRGLGAQLPIDGVMRASTRGALRAFQRRQGLPVSGFIGPDTEAALRNVRADADAEFELEQELTGAALKADEDLKNAPRYSFVNTLKRVGKVPQRGLYRIFREDGKFYTGMATDLRRRIVQHYWCLSHLGASPKGYKVAVAALPALQPDQIRNIERQINQHYRGKSLNSQAELEMEEIVQA